VGHRRAESPSNSIRAAASTHPAIDAMLALVRDMTSNPQTLKGTSRGRNTRGWSIRTAESAKRARRKFSVQYCLARALLDRGRDRSVRRHAYKDARTREMTSRVHAALIRPRIPATSFRREVKVTLKNGTVLATR